MLVQLRKTVENLLAADLIGHDRTIAAKVSPDAHLRPVTTESLGRGYTLALSAYKADDGTIRVRLVVRVPLGAMVPVVAVEMDRPGIVSFNQSERSARIDVAVPDNGALVAFACVRLSILPPAVGAAPRVA